MKPTVVIVTGAWHTPAAYDPMAQKLEAAGFPVVCKKLPSVNFAGPSSEATVAADTEFVRREMLLPEIEEAGREVIVVTHSFGGLPGGGAVVGLSRAERAAEGEKGGVLGFIYMTAFLGREGLVPAELDRDGEAPSAWYNTDLEMGTLTVGGPGPAEIFFNTTADPALIERTVASLGYHSITSFTSPMGRQAWDDPIFDGRRAYVFAHRDNAIPINVQKFMVKGSGRAWLEYDLPSDHSPFVSAPGDMCRITEELAEKWA